MPRGTGRALRSWGDKVAQRWRGSGSHHSQDLQSSPPLTVMLSVEARPGKVLCVRSRMGSISSSTWFRRTDWAAEKCSSPCRETRWGWLDLASGPRLWSLGLGLLACDVRAFVTLPLLEGDHAAEEPAESLPEQPGVLVGQAADGAPLHVWTCQVALFRLCFSISKMRAAISSPGGAN